MPKREAGNKKTDVQREGQKKRDAEKREGGADQKGNRERKSKQQERCLCGRKDDGEGDVLVAGGK